MAIATWLAEGDDDLAAAGRLLHDFNTEYDDPSPGAPWLAERLAALAEDDGTLILLGGEGALPEGVAVVRRRDAIWTGAEEWYLAELYVVPRRRGHGIGRALMTAVLELAITEGADTIDLATTEDDIAARGLYEAMGFTRYEGGGSALSFYYEREV